MNFCRENSIFSLHKFSILEYSCSGYPQNPPLQNSPQKLPPLENSQVAQIIYFDQQASGPIQNFKSKQVYGLGVLGIGIRGCAEGP